MQLSTTNASEQLSFQFEWFHLTYSRFMATWILSNDLLLVFLWCGAFISAITHIFVFFSQVDDILETKLDRKFKIITDKGTLDAIGLHPDGRAKRYNCDLETQREFWAHLRLIQLIPFLMGLGRIKTCKVNPLQSSSIPTKPNKPLVVNVVGTRNN